MNKNISLTLEASVIVKPNIQDPDLGIDIGGWQGRISEIDPDNDLICIDWDSLTLKNIPAAVIAHCRAEDLNWDQLYLGSTEVELTTARDTPEDVAKVKAQLEHQHHLGAERSEAIPSTLPAKTASEEARRQSGCLLLFLGYHILAGVVAPILYLTYFLSPDNDVFRNTSFGVAVWQVAIGILMALFGVAASNWRKWGVFGFVATIIMGNLVGFSQNPTANVLFLTIPLIQIGLTIYLAGQKWHFFK